MGFLAWLRKRSGILSAFSAALATLFFFHNCSRVDLKMVDTQVSSSVLSLTLESHICPAANFGPNDSTKFVFIVDLSASNFGDWVQLGNGYYFDPTLGTDNTGTRFAAINNFITTCGQSAVGAQFSIIGFSAGAGSITNNVLSCQSTTFVNAATAIGEVNALAARQTLDYNNGYKQFETNPYQGTMPNTIIYANTSYSSATNCLEKVISNDLTNPNNLSDRYHILFISDGVPNDPLGKGCQDTVKYPTAELKTQCYYDTSVDPLTMVRTAAASKGKELYLQGIYYGSNTTVPFVLDELSKQGGTSGAVVLNNFTGANALCQLIAAPSGISYRPDVYVGINLTMSYKAGVISADSDMDGLADIDELMLGYDPVSPRSRVPGVLDGICQRLGGVAQCQARVSSVACNPAGFPGLGLLSDCDIDVLRLRAGAPGGDIGVDYDRDGMPDFVEIIKGTDPRTADMASDTDGDGKTNRDELLSGTDPYFVESNIDTNTLNIFTVDPTDNSQYAQCTNGDWTLSAKQLLFGPTLSLQSANTSLNHAQDNQKIMVFYRSAPLNSLVPQLEYHVSFVDVWQDPFSSQLSSSSGSLGPTDFVLLGKVQ